MELRSRSEIVRHWLQTDRVPEPLREQLRLQILDIQSELTALEAAKRPDSAARLREAS